MRELNKTSLNQTNLEGVIFDMDGVLVDSEPVIQSAAVAGLREYGAPAEPEDFIPYIGTGEDSYIGNVARKYGLVYKQEMKKRVYEIYLDIVSSMLKVYEGTNELLESLKNDGVPMALASSADRIKVEANLRVAEIPISTFVAIVTADDVEQKKPSPEIYLTTAEKMATRPQNCVVIEDSISGIQSAKAAGMKCIAITSTFDRKLLERQNPDFICNSIAKVYSVIKENF